MAKACLIADVTVNQPEWYTEYQRNVPALVAKYGGRCVVRAPLVHPLEGELGDSRVTVVEFESMETARRSYDSAEYAPLLKLRLEATRSRTAFVEGFAAA